MAVNEAGRGLEEAARAVARVAARAADLAADERAALLRALDAVGGVLATARADLLAAQRESGVWRAKGDPTFEAWRARTSRAGMRAAATEVRRGEVLTSMPSVREAVESGRVTVEHVDVVARTAATASEPVRRALASPEGQAELLQVATRVDAGRFARAVARWAAALDRSALERGHQAQRAARFLNLAETPTGTRVSGLLDSVAGHRLRLALEAVAGKPAPDDERSPEQRRADALETLAGAALAMTSSGGVPVGPRASVTMVLREETWAALRRTARGGDVARSGDAGGAVAPATIDDDAALPPSETARLLCDCELTRVVVDAQGQPLDLGRAVRLHTPAQRRGITVRDGGCFWPGCGAPTRWCEVHHLAWWDRDDGPTSVLDGALACSFHHHELHRRDLVVTRYLLPAGARAGESAVRYVVATPEGRVLADGRPADAAGEPLGTAVRRWVPGHGAVDLTGAGRSGPPRPPGERRPMDGPSPGERRPMDGPSSGERRPVYGPPPRTGGSAPPPPRPGAGPGARQGGARQGARQGARPGVRQGAVANARPG
ncbi:MAG: DUF222 domain-containing protein [Actinomycetales bacterium]|nr:DUF222 domain-containing protein [Actinomycetales bacterium]